MELSFGDVVWLIQFLEEYRDAISKLLSNSEEKFTEFFLKSNEIEIKDFSYKDAFNEMSDRYDKINKLLDVLKKEK